MPTIPPSGYTQVFGGQNIFVAQLTLLQLNPQTANIQLYWPIEQALPGTSVFADIIESTPGVGLSISMPDATIAALGQSCLVNNLGANALTIKDFAGNTIGSVPSGQVWQFYLDANTTQAGVWKTFQFGTGVSSATAAALAGPGLKAAGSVLETRLVPTSTAVTPFTLVDADRARVIIWSGGVGQINLPNPATVGTDWMIYLINKGTGNWSVVTPSGVIDGGTNTKVLAVGETATFLTDGTNWFTLGYGKVITSLFDHTSINVAGTGDYVLGSGGPAELNRISYTLTGVLTGPRNLVVPTANQQYWIFNNTSGAFTLTVKTAAGTGVVVPQGLSMILACDGINVISYEGTPSTGVIPVPLGGTGLTTFNQGDLLYASAANTLSALAKNVSATRYLANTGASNAPVWDQVALDTGVKNRLPLNNLVQVNANSVLGNPTNALGDVTFWVASADGQILRRTLGNLGFGSIDLTNTVSVTGAQQGDLLYGSAINQWAILSKSTDAYAHLTNEGTTNNPIWKRPRFVAQANTNSDYTFALTDAWSWTPHTGAATQTWTVPANGSVAFHTGDMLGIDNRLGAGALTIQAAAGVTIDGHGISVTGAPTTFMVLPPGYKMLLVKMATDTWLALTDAPQSGAAIGSTYSGYLNAGGGSLPASSILPAGWSASRTSAGIYVVTHNLGLSNTEGLAVVATVVNGSGNTHVWRNGQTANTFTLGVANAGTGIVTDQDVAFTATRIAA